MCVYESMSFAPSDATHGVLIDFLDAPSAVITAHRASNEYREQLARMGLICASHLTNMTETVDVSNDSFVLRMM